MQTIRIATTDIHSRRKLLKLPICCYPSPTRTPKREVSPRPKHPPCLPALSQRACPALHSPKLTVIQSLLLQSKPAHRDSRRRIDSCALCIVQPDPRPPSTHTSPYPLATRLCLESTLPSCQQPYYFRRKHTAARGKPDRLPPQPSRSPCQASDPPRKHSQLQPEADDQDIRAAVTQTSPPRHRQTLSALTWPTNSLRKASTRLRLPKPTLWPTLHPKLSPMSSKTNTPATTRTLIWTEIKKVYKAKVSAISRSKSRTDGCPSQMVGHVSSSALSVCDWQFCQNLIC
jgi:hypothetical protein